MADTAGATVCKRCNNPSSVLIDGCCAACWSHEEVPHLRAQLREAERLARIHLVQAWQREDITRAERDGAIRRGAEAWCWGQAGWNTARKWLVWHDDEQRLKDAAIKRGKQLLQYSRNQEISLGTFAQKLYDMEKRAEAAEALVADVCRSHSLPLPYALRPIGGVPAEAQKEGDGD